MGAQGSKVVNGKEECPFGNEKFDKNSGTSETGVSKQKASSHKMSIYSSSKKKGKGSKHEEIVKYLFPVYFVDEPLTVEEVALARHSWELIGDDLSPQWLKMKSESAAQTVKYRGCQEWFQTIFYERLFDVHPISKAMFRNPRNQGVFLVALFSFIFTALEYPKAFKDRLEHLAETHSKKGIKAVEYGVIGEVMFWALQQCLGSEGYPLQVHSAWVKLFSSMLRVIVPVAVTYELKDGNAQKDRLSKTCPFSAFAYEESENERDQTNVSAATAAADVNLVATDMVKSKSSTGGDAPSVKVVDSSVGASLPPSLSVNADLVPKDSGNDVVADSAAVTV